MLRILLRRWYIVVPLLLLSVVGAATVRQGVQPGYTVEAVAIVLPPNQARVQTDAGVEVRPVNPFLNVSGNTLVAARALSVLGTTAGFRDAIGVDGRAAAYTVTVPARDPLLTVTVESQDREFALRAADDVLAGLAAELQRQQPLPQPESQLTILTLSPPSLVLVDNSPLRAGIVTFVVGLLLTLIITVLVEAGLARSRRRLDRDTAALPAQSEQEVERTIYSDAARS